MSKFLVHPKFGPNKIASVLSKYNYQVKTGDILAGTIVGKEKKLTLVNVGLKQVAFLPHEEVFIEKLENSRAIFLTTQIGEFIVLFSNLKTYRIIVSLKRLHYIRLWERLKQMDFKNMIFFTHYEKSIWGGKLTNFDGLKVFVPNSHLPKYYKRKNLLEKFLTLKILEVKEKNNSVTGSSKLAFFKKHCSCLQIGMNQKTCILAIRPFGIFVNIYGLKCLVHISEISNKKIDNLNQLYNPGDQIVVKIIYINMSQGKIAASLKQV